MTSPDASTVAESQDAVDPDPLIPGQATPDEAAGDEAAGDEERAQATEDVQEDASEEEKPDRGPGPGDELSDEELERAVCALLFASPEPLGRDRLVKLLDRPVPARVEAAVARLQERFDGAELPLEVAEIAGGWRILTAPDVTDVVQRLTKVRGAEKVTPAGLETLAIVAYRQPVTNAEVEAIRGVQSGAMLRTLVDRGLVRVTGRADQPGSPLQYGTTKEFLDRFGLKSLKDLPRDGELADG